MTLLGNMLSKIYMKRTLGLFKASPKGSGVIVKHFQQHVNMAVMDRMAVGAS